MPRRKPSFVTEELPPPQVNHEEEERARRREELLALAKQQEEAEQTIMDCLVENDTAPGALAELATSGLEISAWSLRYMIVERIGRQILLNTDYTQEDLQAWLVPYALNDEKSYVRRAAIKHLTDIKALARASSEDGEPIVRKKAIEQLLKFTRKEDALAALNVVSTKDPVPELRLMAVLNIVDQNVIAQVAKTDVEPTIRQAATKKLTSQEVLGWLTINDPTPLVRSTAAELMTDVTALVKAAASSPPAQEDDTEAYAEEYEEDQEHEE